jgi:short-subunit dehydrogenase
VIDHRVKNQQGKEKNRAKKSCVITGAASGIGAALAEVFKEDYTIIGIDRDFSKAKQVMNDLGAKANVRFIIAELTSKAGQERIIEELEHEDVALFIHSAGINAVAPFAASDLQTQLTVLDVNLHAPVLLTKTLLSRHVLKKGSSLVFISSLSHFVGYPGASSYAASKDGLASFARSLSAALHREGIHVMTVFPGPTRTPHAAQHSPDNSREAKRMPPEVLAEKIKNALGQGRHRYVPGLSNKLFALAGKLFPRLVERAMKGAIFDKL